VEDASAFEIVARPVLFAALAALAFVPLEHLLPAHLDRRQLFAADVGFATLGQILVAAGVVVVIGWSLARLDDLALEQPLWSAVGDRRVRAALDVGSGLLLFELASYLYHRLAHRVPWLWRLHEVHHSSQTMDWLASFRQHPLEILLQTLAQNGPLVLLGIPLGAHATVLMLLKLNTVFVHANIRVPAGPWTEVVATPAFHHRHHQRAGDTRNYASLFPFIDRLFGTYCGDVATEFGPAETGPQGFLELLLRSGAGTRRRVDGA
jgi:sterol desaturase/sphingolipid hydroxylase (fatty acid hydroxylase superfamily)